MMNKEAIAKALGEEGLAIVDRLFDIASSNGVESVVLNCHSRNVTVKFEDEEVDPETYYHDMLESCKIGKKANGVFGKWKKRQLGKMTLAHYQQLIGKELKILLESGFLILDGWTFTEELAKYADELEKWGLGVSKEHELRYCLLRQMMSLEDNRLIVDESIAGNYLSTRRDELSQKDILCFFCFVQLCQIVNGKIDELDNPKDVLSEADKSLLDRLLRYVDNGDWQMPATCANVKSFIGELFKLKEFRDFFKGGRGGANTDRVEVSMANILGYLKRYQLIAGGQQQISIDVFGNANQVGNINKGHDNNASQAFAKLESLMDKYRQMLIG